MGSPLYPGNDHIFVCYYKKKLLLRASTFFAFFPSINDTFAIFSEIFEVTAFHRRWILFAQIPAWLSLFEEEVMANFPFWTFRQRKLTPMSGRPYIKSQLLRDNVHAGIVSATTIRKLTLLKPQCKELSLFAPNPDLHNSWTTSKFFFRKNSFPGNIIWANMFKSISKLSEFSQRKKFPKTPSWPKTSMSRQHFSQISEANQNHDK